VTHVFALVVRFDLPDAAAAQAFDELTALAVPLILADEPGTLVYEPHAVEDAPLARVFYEVYSDREAHAEHERQPHTMRFLAGVRALVTTTRVELLTPQLPTGGLAAQLAGDDGNCTSVTLAPGGNANSDASGVAL